MFEYYLKLLNGKNTIKESMKDIIDAFSDFYGSNTRNEIREKFNNAHYTTFVKPQELKRAYKAIKSHYTTLFINKIHASLNMNDKISRIYINDFSLDQIENSKIYKYITFIKYYDMGFEGRIKEKRKQAVEYFSRFLPNLNEKNFYYEVINSPKYQALHGESKKKWDYYLSDAVPLMEYEDAKKDVVSMLQSVYNGVNLENIEALEKKNKLSKERKIVQAIKPILKEYEKTMDTFEPIKKVIERYERLENELFHKYCVKFVKEFKDYIDDTVVFDFDMSGDDNRIQYYFGANSLLQAFSRKYERTLSHFEKRNLINQRIQFFKSMGINLGDDYETYKNSKRCQRLIPPEDILEKMIQRNKDYQIETKTKLYYGLNQYMVARKEIDELDLMIKDDEYDIQTLDKVVACVMPNAKLLNENVIVYPIIYLSSDIHTGYEDNTLIHELNHLYEMYVKKIESDGIIFVSGWYQTKEYFSGRHDIEDDSIKDYRIFNEVINEKITQEITKKLHKRGRYIFNHSGFAKIKHSTTYEEVNFLIDEFYDKFKSDIIKSRRNGRIDIIYNAVGQDNFDALDDLINEFRTYFGTRSYVDIIKNNDSEEIKELDELKQKRDMIMKNIDNYRQQKHNNSFNIAI